MVDKAHSLADSLFPEWTDRSKSDFGEFLIELFALFSEKDFWYINAFANEGIFRKIRSYSNAFSKASTLGYEPTLCRGAEALFSVSFKAGSPTLYARGELVVVVNGVEYSNDEQFTVENSNAVVTKQLTLKEGKQVVEDATFNGYCVFLRRTNIDIDSIKVTIDNVVYSRVKNFGNSGETSANYLVLPEEDGSCSIFFGSGGYGYTPPIGKVVQVEYRICNGTKGNQIIADAEINDSLEERPAVSVRMMSEAIGGTYAETLVGIKESAPMFFGNKKAAINSFVAEELLNSYPFISKSKVTSIGYNMTYQVIPMSGDLEISSAEKRQLESDFEKYAIAGYDVSWAPNNYCNFMYSCNTFATKVLIDVVATPGYSSLVVESGVRQVMADFTNPLALAEYGASFSKSEMETLIRSRVTDVQSVAFKVLLGTTEQAIPDFTLSETEIFREINQDDLEVRINAV
jgi:hypothetical protein